MMTDGATTENATKVAELMQDNTNLHLVLPLLLEGAIRGSAVAMYKIILAYRRAFRKENVGLDRLPAAPLGFYWTKLGLKNFSEKLGREDRTQQKQINEELKEGLGIKCSLCGKKDSETITLLKCDGCHIHFYCSKACQQKIWVEGQHAGVCRQLGILQQYHKPFAKKIWTDIAVHGIPPKDILELQDLRQRLGLSRPQADYQDSLNAAKAGRPDPVQLVLPRKDGTVQIGSFPRPI